METSNSFINQLTIGFSTARRAFRLICTHKRLLVYQIAPTIAAVCIGIILLLLGLVSSVHITFEDTQFLSLFSPPLWWLTTSKMLSKFFWNFAYLVFNTWSLAALTHHTYTLVQGAPSSMYASFSYVLTFYRPLIYWTLFSSIIFFIPFIGQLIMFLCWFIIPVIVIGQVQTVRDLLVQTSRVFMQLFIRLVGSSLFILVSALITFLIVSTLFGLFLFITFGVFIGQIIITTWTVVTATLLYLEKNRLE